MPKDPKRSVDSYQVRGGDINEFEFHHNQEAFARRKQNPDANLIPGTPPEKKAPGLQPVVAKRASKKATKQKAATKASVSARGASAKKLAARKATRKK